VSCRVEPEHGRNYEPRGAHRGVDDGRNGAPLVGQEIQNIDPPQGNEEW